MAVFIRWAQVRKFSRSGGDEVHPEHNVQDAVQAVNRLYKIRYNPSRISGRRVHLTSAAGKLMLTMLAAVAGMERDLLVERTHSGLARAKAEGKTLGLPTRAQTGVKGRMSRCLRKGKSARKLVSTFVARLLTAQASPLRRLLRDW